jgi:hypothetical protein
MEPYYQAWHESTHKNVPCADCHFEPGFRNTVWGKIQASNQAVAYFTRTYDSKPHAEIQDASCLRSGCHDRRLLEGKVNWELGTQRGGKVTIRFDHGPHIQQLRRGKELRCVSCHSQMVQGQHIVVTLDSCFICHFKGMQHGREDETLGGCEACHEAPKEQIRLATGLFSHADYLQRGVTCDNCHADVVRGDGAVPRQQCWSCHNQPHHLARYAETGFIHQKHVSEKKVECFSCHLQIEHHLSAAVRASSPSKAAAGGARGPDPLAESGACGECHQQTHAGPAELYRGVGGRGVPEMPSPMHRAQVDCNACHQVRTRTSETAEVLGQTYSAVQASCDYCHGHQYDGVLEEWKATIASHLDRAEAAYVEAEASLTGASLSAEDRLKRLRLLDDAGHNIRMVKLGHGVHNVNYATALLNVSLERCAELLKTPPHQRPAEEPDL